MDDFTEIPSSSGLFTRVTDEAVKEELPAWALGPDAPPEPGAAPGPAAAPRRRPRHPVAGAIEVAVLAGLTGAGLACPWGTAVYYRALLFAFAAITGPVLRGSLASTWASERSSKRFERLQGMRRRPTLALRGARDTMVAGWIAACLAAWAISRAWAGLPIGLTWSLAEAGGLPLVLVQTGGSLLVLDAWLYWKHRLLHTQLMFPFHRAHHTYRDPTSMTSFAVGPVESLLTFWPVLLVAWPEAKHWAPLYFPVIVVFIGLNLYLHCGFTLRFLEATLPRLFVNTSAFHNVHHANAEANFGEAMSLWDHLCRTRLEDRKKG